jgi:hypothetical protein
VSKEVKYPVVPSIKIVPQPTTPLVSPLPSPNSQKKLVSPHSTQIPNPLMPSFSVKQPTDEEEEDEMDVFDVKIKGKEGKLGEIKLASGALLSDARKALRADSKFPTDFQFWFEKMQSTVEEHQEAKMKVSILGNTLILRREYLP